MKTIGLIIAAGKQTRFSLELPKALVPIAEGKSLLEVNINELKKRCDRIYITCSKENINFFKKEISRIKIPGVFLIEIESGLGCGDAVLKSLRWLNKYFTNLNNVDPISVLMLWGDSLQDNETIWDSLNTFEFGNSDIVVPVKYEETPYVKFIEKNEYINSVKFSKYGDTCKNGYHDFSIFYFNLKPVLKFLEKLRKKFTDKKNKLEYTCRDNQLIFLDIFNYTDIKGKLLPIEANEIINGFNTLDEYLLMCGQRST